MTQALPDAWREVSNPDYIVEKYRPREPTLFVREGHDVGVHVLPISTSSPHDEERYRVGAIRGGADEFQGERPVETHEEHERALRTALQFTEIYESKYRMWNDQNEALERALETAERYRRSGTEP